MTALYWLSALTILCVIIFTDLNYRWITKRWAAFFGLLVLPHAPAAYSLGESSFGDAAVPFQMTLIFTTFWFMARLSFHIAECRVPISLRVRIMMGGRRLALSALYASLVQIPLCILLYRYKDELSLSTAASTADIIVTWILLGMILMNGAIRIMATSRRLGITKRVIFLLVAWIPIVNFVVCVWLCGIVKQEFVHAVQQWELENARADSQICKTRYPLLMLHGIGFRDYKYVNYWGRIPAKLIRNGAEVYHGHQQAWGTVENNAREIKETLEKILAETDCEKVNIIAHSKGGLDARYLISTLDMGDAVASLTTISTPHRGSELIDVLERLPDGFYRRISGFIDAYFRKLGDRAPDCYTASKQLSPEFLTAFNETNQDAPDVYYQSWAAEMKGATSNSLLMLPFAIMRWASGNNDGLVTIDSAKWGDFRGTFQSRTHRGISHGDLIDLMHQDYEGFDISEEYVRIVSELKEKGF